MTLWVLVVRELRKLRRFGGKTKKRPSSPKTKNHDSSLCTVLSDISPHIVVKLFGRKARGARPWRDVHGKYGETQIFCTYFPISKPKSTLPSPRRDQARLHPGQLHHNVWGDAPEHSVKRLSVIPPIERGYRFFDILR
jgi:hypothetical protein